MDQFSISQLAQFSGIKPHTIRIWEQRYDALTPKRTEGNTRTYSGADLKRLLNIVSLIDGDYKVSELCTKDDKELNNLIKELYRLDEKVNSNQYVPQLISAGMEFNEPEFQKTLSYCVAKFGMKDTYKNVIYPLINQVGLLWSADLLPPAHEHFMSNLIRQKILTATDALPFPKKDSEKWLLFLPEDEFHEIGLLFAHYVLKQKGIEVIYLGANVPINTLQSAIKSINPNYLLLFFVHYDVLKSVQAYLLEIGEFSKKQMLIISGNQKLINQLNLDSNMKWLKNINDLERI